MGNQTVTTGTATYVVSGSTKNYDAEQQLVIRTGGVGTAYAYLFIKSPVPAGGVVLSAKLELFAHKTEATNTHVVEVDRIKQAFSPSSVTFDKRPVGYYGDKRSATKVGVAPDKTLWSIDVTPHAQAWANGDVNYGWRLSAPNDTAARIFYSSNATNLALRPRLVVVWADNPSKPINLSPAGARSVSFTKPTLTAKYIDVSGSVTLQAVRVQIAASAAALNANTPVWDSQEVITSAPELDLSTTSYPGLTDGQTVWWRIQMKDAAGLWSVWSDPVSFKRDAKGVLTLLNPPTPTSTGLDIPVAVEGFTVPPKGAREFLTLTPLAALKANQFAAVAMNDTTRHIFTIQHDTNDNMQISRFNGDTGAYMDNMVVTAGGHYGLMYVDWDGTNSFIRFEHESLKSWVRLQYTVAKTWTTAQASAFKIATPKYSSAGVKNPVWFQSETIYEGKFYRLAGSPSTTKPYIPGRIEVITGKRIESKIDLSHVGRVGNVKTGAAVGGRAEPVGISVFNNDGWPFLMIGTAINTSTSGYQLRLYRYALPFPKAGLDPNEPTFDLNTDSFVNDATFPIFWTFTGETQIAWQILISRPRLAETDMPGTLLYDSGKKTTSDTTFTVPANIIKHSGVGYRVTLRIWDAKARENTPDDPAYTEVERDFIYIFSKNTTPVTSVSAEQIGVTPRVKVLWEDATAHDSYNIICNGLVLVTGLIPQNVDNGEGSYEWIDNSASPDRDLVYTVQGVTNGKASSNNPTFTINVQILGTWLYDPIADESLVISGRSDRKITLNEATTVLEPIAANANRIIIRQGLGGGQGTVTGSLINEFPGTDEDARDWRVIFMRMRRNSGRLFYLTERDYTRLVAINNFTYSQRGVSEEVYDISFDWFGQDDLSGLTRGE